ncbi:hypothetical protein GGQ74_002832 [Desulfobaculum xiamenense]|uniref:Glycosyl transferase family 2 n=1 Tax=Desulfobaculum xiamenense TaxID=995050 RepID=A0A846QLU3_9BACT|nr:hypothetical protein [Desulfobaculum xiamenense]NJB69138.1 hypothetical protein [Desulfobaculum xiamenense]
MSSDCKIGLHVLLFDVDEFFDRYMQNCAPFFDKIYAAYSDTPWSYKETDIKNSTSIEAVREKWGDKLTIIEGRWDTDEGQRNSCLDQALKDGCTHLVIQDADEFYEESIYPSLLASIAQNPDYDAYRTRWNTFWKSTDYILAHKGRPANDSVVFAINIAKGNRFVHMRDCSPRTSLQLDGICYHLSYVRSDEYIYRKLNTWSHARDFDTERWYQDKWLRWYPGKRNLHPVEPDKWAEAIPFTGKLPDALRDFPAPDNSIYKPSPFERVQDAFTTAREYADKTLARMMRSFRKRIGTSR